MTDAQTAAQPVHKERLGRIKASVWMNDTTNGPMYNVTFARVYRRDDEWKESYSYTRDDCLVLAQLAQLVSVWIYQHPLTQTSEPEAA